MEQISLDIHIATIPTVPKEWVDQCINSVYYAMSLVDYPINLHVVDGVKDHVGKARQLGYSKGKNNYVTYVDCDDYVLPEAFTCLESAMGHDVAMIRTGELGLQNERFVDMPIGQFHLIVYRRDVIEKVDYENHPLKIDMVTKTIGESHPDGFINIPSSVYVQRMYWGSASRILARKLHKMESNND